MSHRSEATDSEVPLSWFGKTLWKFSPLYIELILLATCLRLIGLGSVDVHLSRMMVAASDMIAL